ncbi:MAG: hypothetical protein NZ551_04860 [Microscillaceae bacterium]|nr:hypothetical protein [Microscillaceae bacterium]MDW8460524.1 hypothetical protein [Cytophagales bacterium]
MNKNYLSTLSYKIKFSYDEKIYDVKTPLPQEIKLYVSANGWQILKKRIGFLNHTTLICPIDNILAQREPYLDKSTILQQAQSLLPDIKVNEVITEGLKLQVNRKISAIFNLKVDSSRIKVVKGYKITSPIEVTPSQIKLFGEESIIRQIPNPIILNLKEHYISAKYAKYVPIPIPYKHKGVVSDKEKAWVQFDVEKEYTYTFNLVLKPINLRESMELKNPTIKVSYTYTESEFGQFPLHDFEAVADFNTFNPQDSTVKVMLTRKPALLNREAITLPNTIKVILSKASK